MDDRIQHPCRLKIGAVRLLDDNAGVLDHPLFTEPLDDVGIGLRRCRAVVEAPALGPSGSVNLLEVVAETTERALTGEVPGNIGEMLGELPPCAGLGNAAPVFGHRRSCEVVELLV